VPEFHARLNVHVCAHRNAHIHTDAHAPPSPPPPALSLSLSHTQDLKDITKAETALAKETLSLNGLLLHLLHKKPLPVKPMRYYSVENLYFPA